ncbi:MAG: PEP-CTERM sorting domain-containing protein [Fimbriimonadia bacterium]|jgi:hypothetical protein
MHRRLALLSLISLSVAATAQFSGNLADYGVDVGGNLFNGPIGGSFADLQPGGGGAGASAASADAGVSGLISWYVWDGFGPHGNAGVGTHKNLRDFGGQQFDVKALYLTNDATYLYIAIVTGFDPAGTADPYGRSRTYRVGDIAINPDWAAKTSQYGIILPTAAVGHLGTASVMAGGLWHTPDKDVGFGPDPYSNYKSGGTLTGIVADVRYSGVLYNGNPVFYSDPVTNTNIPLRLLEARIAWADLGLNYGDTVNVSWAVSCNNDSLAGAHTLAVPEPSTVSALLAAMGSFAAMARRRRR